MFMAESTNASHRSHPTLVLLAMSLGVLVAQIDTSVVSLAVKRIGADLGAGVEVGHVVVGGPYAVLF